MKRLTLLLRSLEDRVVHFLDINAFSILRISIGLIYVVFGVLKFFPQYSPAEKLASDTICMITSDLLSGGTACFVLALIETFIGFALILNLWLRGIILLTLWHMACTFLPLILLPDSTFTSHPFSFSIVGQYIFKNVVIVSALLVLYNHSRKKARQ